MIDAKNEHEDLVLAGVHFGYLSSRRHPTIRAFISENSGRADTFDLPKIKQKLAEAEDFLFQLGKEKKEILFVGTKPEVRSLIEKLAVVSEMAYMTERWVPGFLTNFSEVRRRVDEFLDLKTKKEKGILPAKTKKERLVLDRKISTMEKFFAGVALLKKLPSALVVIDPRREEIAVREAYTLGIPAIALANSDCDIREISHLIPGNDSASSSISFVLAKIFSAYERGKNSEVV